MHMAGEHAIGHLAYQETDLGIGLRGGGKRVAAINPGQAVNRQLCVLASFVRQRVVQLDAQADDVVGECGAGHHPATYGAAGLLGGHVYFDGDIGLWHRLAGQDHAGVQIFVRQDVGGLSQLLDLAVDQLAFTGCAATHAAAVREINAFAQRCLEQGLLGIDHDGHPIDAGLVGAGLLEKRKHWRTVSLMALSICIL